MDYLFLEQFTSHYADKLKEAGFVYDPEQITKIPANDGIVYSVLTMKNDQADFLYIEETAYENKNKKHEIHFSFSSHDNDIKHSRMLGYLDTIFNVDFKYIEAIHDSYLQSGIDIGLFVKTGEVAFNSKDLLIHQDTSIISKKNKIKINNVIYNPIVEKMIKTKKVMLNCNISPTFEKGKLTVLFQISGLIFDQNLHLFYNSDQEYILVHAPSPKDGTDVLNTKLLYSYFYDYFKKRIDLKFLNMDVDLTTMNKELFDKYVDVIDMTKI